MASDDVVKLGRLYLLQILCAMLLGLAAGGSAWAADDPRQVARQQYARGIELANQGDYEAALQAFRDAYAMSPNFAVLYNIGQAQIAIHEPLEAIEALAGYLREGGAGVAPARRQEVEAQIALLQASLAELTVTADGPGVLISVDGHEVGRTPLDKPVRLAAGRHEVAAAYDGKAPVSRTVTLAEGERQALSLGVPASAVPAAATVTEPGPAALVAAPRAPEPPAEHEARPSAVTAYSVAGYAAAGAGIVLGGAALGVYLANRSRYQDWQAADATLRKEDPSAPGHDAGVTAHNQVADSLTQADHRITALSIAGGVLAAGGITLLVIDRLRRGSVRETAPRSTSSGFQLDWGGSALSSVAVSWRAGW
jgi:hypothetical protein